MALQNEHFEVWLWTTPGCAASLHKEERKALAPHQNILPNQINNSLPTFKKMNKCCAFRKQVISGVSGSGNRSGKDRKRGV